MERQAIKVCSGVTDVNWQNGNSEASSKKICETEYLKSVAQSQPETEVTPCVFAGIPAMCVRSPKGDLWIYNTRGSIHVYGHFSKDELNKMVPYITFIL